MKDWEQAEDNHSTTKWLPSLMAMEEESHGLGVPAPLVIGVSKPNESVRAS